MTRPLPLGISDAIFDELADQTQFEQHIRKHYFHFCFQFGFEPVFIKNRMPLVYEAYVADKELLRTALPKSSDTPDHFNLAGMLVFWLSKFATVSDLRTLSIQHQGSEDGILLLEQYASELPAFNLGLSLCNFFERNKSPRNQENKIIPDIDLDYLKAICYLMRFKNISPHALGMIYKSLYVQFTQLDKLT